MCRAKVQGDDNQPETPQQTLLPRKLPSRWTPQVESAGVDIVSHKESERFVDGAERMCMTTAINRILPTRTLLARGQTSRMTLRKWRARARISFPGWCRENVHDDCHQLSSSNANRQTSRMTMRKWKARVRTLFYGIASELRVARCVCRRSSREQLATTGDRSRGACRKAQRPLVGRSGLATHLCCQDLCAAGVRFASFVTSSSVTGCCQKKYKI